MNATLFACLLLAADMPSLPPAPPADVPRHVPLTSKAVTNNKRMVRTLAATPAESETKLAPVVTVETLKVMLVEVDGSDIRGTNQSSMLKFSAPNPTKGRYYVSVSGDMRTWTDILIGIGDDPIIVYDFTHFSVTNKFFRFTVDSGK